MTAAPKLRSYQVEVIDRVAAEIAAGRRRVLLVAPTGSGKTVIAAAIIAEAAENGRSILVIAHRREIVEQTSQEAVRGRGRCRDHPGRLPAAAGSAGAGRQDPDPARSRDPRLGRWRCRRPTSWSSTKRTTPAPRPTKTMIDAYPQRDRHRLDGDAMPARRARARQHLRCAGRMPAGRGAGRAKGYLVPSRVYAPSTPDLTGVRVERGDYVEIAARRRGSTQPSWSAISARTG